MVPHFNIIICFYKQNSLNPRLPNELNKYELVEKIGQGAFGEVVLAAHKKNRSKSLHQNNREQP